MPEVEAAIRARSPVRGSSWAVQALSRTVITAKVPARTGSNVAVRSHFDRSAQSEATGGMPAGLSRSAIPPTAMLQATTMMEPTRNAWVPLGAWFRRRGAKVLLVPAEQSADLRKYYSKHAKTDRLDSRILAKLPLPHPEGLREEETIGPGTPLKRTVKIRSGLVHRRSTAMHRLDALLGLLGPGRTAAIGTDMTLTAIRFLARYASRLRVRRLGEFFRRSSRAAWGPGPPLRSWRRPGRRSSSGARTEWTSRGLRRTSPSKPVSRWRS